MTGQADVRWIWMAVALVVVAVPLLTVLVSREVRALHERVIEVEQRVVSLRNAEAVRADAEARAARTADDLDKRTAEAGARLAAGLAAQQREQLLDVLRTLNAMRPAEPEFTEEYHLDDRAAATDESTVRYAVNVDLVWIPDPRLSDGYGRLLLRRTVHPRWPGAEAGPVTGFWISAVLPEDALLLVPPRQEADRWDRIVLGQPVTSVAHPVTLLPPTDGDLRDLRALLARPTPADQPPERTTRPLLDLDATVRVTPAGPAIERARVGHAAADVLTIGLRPVLHGSLAAMRRCAAHPGTPAPAGGHERSARRSHWYREAELTRAVIAGLEQREATGEPDDVTVARFRSTHPDGPRTGQAEPDPIPVRAAGAFGRFLRGLTVMSAVDGTHLMTRAPSGTPLLHDAGTARALAAALAPAPADHDVVTLQGLLRAIADDLPTDWKDGRDLELDPTGPASAVRVDAR
jgi:hypothetical protein